MQKPSPVKMLANVLKSADNGIRRRTPAFVRFDAQFE
jgi:hypothetical protein